MDIRFSDEDIAFRDEVRAFLATHLTAELREGAHASTAAFVEPDIGLKWQRILHEKGWLAYNWPKEYGGTGWTPVQRYLFEKELALAGAPALPVLGLKLVGPVIYTFGTPEQKAKFLPRILSGDDYWCQGFSEPGSGSDLANLQTRAELKDGKYVVNGTKIWTTQGHHANWIFCLVRTDPTVRPQAGISFLLIDIKQPGFSISPIVTLAGDHEVNQVFFDDVVSDADNLVGAPGQGWAIAKFLLENERSSSCFAPELMAQLDRIAQAAVSEPSGHGGAMIDDPVFAGRLARTRLEIEALEMTEFRILAELSQGRAPGPQTSMLKALASSLHKDIGQLAVDLYGAAGLQLPAERPLYGPDASAPVHSKDAQLAAPRYLNNLAWTIFGGTNEIQYNIIAKTVLGL